MGYHPSPLKSCFWIFFLTLHLHQCLGCLYKERLALLDFKAAVLQFTDPFQSWVHDQTSDCCSWERVKCHHATHRVSQLHLDNIYANILVNNKRPPLLNASLFLPFKDLQHLDISANGIDGWHNHQGFERFSMLKSLEFLNLATNKFNSSVLAPLSDLTSIKTLNLGGNYLGEGPWSDISQGFENLSKLEKLEVLSLSSNSFSSNILGLLSKLTPLKTLNLDDNLIGDGSALEISQGICELKNLRDINLSGNRLRGDIPSCLQNFTSLLNLDLSKNELSGNIPPSLTSNMTSLRRLDLSENQLIGSIPPSLLFNLTFVQIVSFSNNYLDGTTFMASFPDQKFLLKAILLSKCNINRSTEELADFFHHQHDLRFIELSHNNIHGEFPVWLARNTWLKFLFLEYNMISGHINFPVQASSLIMFDISNNQIEGHLQENIGDYLPSLVSLNLSTNALKGKIPISVGKMTNLEHLDLSNNNFTEEIPETLASRKSLSFLVLSNNRLHGLLSPLLFFNNSLGSLHLNNNQFSGFISIPDDNNFVSKTLYTMDISRNNMSGRLPTWISNLTGILSLLMGDNSFEGAIPLEICNLVSLQYLDLSKNEFSGDMPSCLNLTALRYMRLQDNQLSGSLLHTILNSPNLVTLNLNNNNLSGNIPSWLGSFENLRNLLVKGNHLSGLIPHELCQLDKIGIMDLSNNLLSGSIPPCFNNMEFGKNGGTFEQDGVSLFSITRSFMEIEGYVPFYDYTERYDVAGEVDIMTKSRLSSYKGDIVYFMAGMDLSHNHFTGKIPHEFGVLIAIRALNLSHNELTGSIPNTLSNLKQLESMDLSHNKLSGEIPSDLIDINTLAVFSVAYNNLSGPVPDLKAQFGTFSNTSYEGNPFLCGPPLEKPCGDTTSIESPTVSFGETSEKFGDDPISFIQSSVLACILSLLALVVVLYIYPYWRRMWFDFIDTCVSTMFPFWSGAFRRVSNPFT